MHGLLATYFTWLQAGRPNHHNSYLARRMAEVNLINALLLCAMSAAPAFAETTKGAETVVFELNLTADVSVVTVLAKAGGVKIAESQAPFIPPRRTRGLQVARSLILGVLIEDCDSTLPRVLYMFHS